MFAHTSAYAQGAKAEEVAVTQAFSTGVIERRRGEQRDNGVALKAPIGRLRSPSGTRVDAARFC